LIFGKRSFGGSATGKAEAVRLLLEYTRIPYTVKAYHDPKDWFQGEKYKLGLDFPNLPYIIDGDFKLTETEAIMIYLCQKANRPDLLGKNEPDKVKVAMLYSVLVDVHRYTMKGIIENKGDEVMKSGIIEEKMHPKLTEFSKFLGSKEFFMGYLTAFDFGFFVVADILNKYEKGLFERYDNFPNWKKRFENIPEIKVAREKSKK